MLGMKTPEEMSDEEIRVAYTELRVAVDEQIAWLDKKLTDEAEYLRVTEEGLREYSRNPKSKMHPVHAANRLRIVRERLTGKEK